MGKTAPEFEDTILICSCNHEPAFHIPKKKTNETIQGLANPQEDYEAVEPGWS
jgi:hypothetical protein